MGYYGKIKKVDKNGIKIPNFKTWYKTHKGEVYFDSRLEFTANREFVAAGLSCEFHPDSVLLQDKFKVNSFEKGEYKENRAIRKMEYTYDFKVIHNGINYLIETKGLEDESYRLRKKHFLYSIKEDTTKVFCQVHTLKEVKLLIKYIKDVK